MSLESELEGIFQGGRSPGHPPPQEALALMPPKLGVGEAHLSAALTSLGGLLIGPLLITSPTTARTWLLRPHGGGSNRNITTSVNSGPRAEAGSPFAHL